MLVVDSPSGPFVETVESVKDRSTGNMPPRLSSDLNAMLVLLISKLCVRLSMSTLCLRWFEMRRMRLVSDSIGCIDWLTFVRLAMPCLTFDSMRLLTDLCLCIRSGR